MSVKNSVEQTCLEFIQEKYGLDEIDCKILGVEYLEDASLLFNAQSVEKILPVPGIKIPYFHPRTGAPLSHRPNWPSAYRVRFVEEPRWAGSFTKPPKPPDKYFQPARIGLSTYFPKIVKGGWVKTLDDPNEALIITEGEFKAAKACKEGFATIGLGGVDSFRTGKNGFPFVLPDFYNVNWIMRNVYICFDSDYRSNPQICRAINDLAERLYDLGATPYFVALPESGDDKKNGLDDYLLANGPEELQALLHMALPLTLARSMLKLNEDWIAVGNPSCVMNLADHTKWKIDDFAQHTNYEAHYDQILNAKGELVAQRGKAGSSWLEWPLAQRVYGLTYKPTHDDTQRVVVQDVIGRPFFNTWLGWGVEPKPGNVKTFFEYWDYLFTGAELLAKEWALRWFAYPFQFPGTKLYTSIVVHGRQQGTGKSMLGYIMGAIYGKNFGEINQGDLSAQFNDWADGKQFILADDVTSISNSEKRADADKIKKMITQHTLRINPKHIGSYSIPDCINYYWTSNHANAFSIDDTDRRMFIHEVTVPPREQEFYKRIEKWWKEEDGAAHLFDYLLKLPMEMSDGSVFDPKAHAYGTNAKERMKEVSLTDLGAWVRNLQEDPDICLSDISGPYSHDLFTAAYLLDYIYPGNKDRITSSRPMIEELKNAGFRQVLNGQQIRWSHPLSGKPMKDRFYVVRNQKKWLSPKITSADVRAHIEGAIKKRKKWRE